MDKFILLDDDTVLIRAGQYVLGDPCYTTPDDDWLPLLESCDYFRGSPVADIGGGKTILGFGTMHGDGCYYDNFGSSYPVDAGLLGLVPIEYAQLNEGKLYPDHIVNFDKDTRAIDNGGGRLIFGQYTINTDYEILEEDEE